MVTTPSNEQSLEGLVDLVRAGADRSLDVLIECSIPHKYSHGHRPSSVPGKVVHRYNSTGRTGVYLAPKYTYSTDEALDLVERLLPDWVVADLSQNSRHAGDPWGCTLALYVGSNPSKNRSVSSGYDFPEPSLAILAALLTALKDAS